MVKYLLTFLMLVSIDRYVSHCFYSIYRCREVSTENKNTVDVKKIFVFDTDTIHVAGSGR